MKTKYLVACAAIVLMSSGHAETPTTLGDYECEQWLNQSTKSAAKQWLLGSLSGLNLAFRGPLKSERARPDPLGHIASEQQVFLWTDNFCKANPSRKLSDAAITLYLGLDSNKQ